MDSTIKKRNIVFTIWLSIISFVTGLATLITTVEFIKYLNVNTDSSVIVIFLRSLFGFGNFISLLFIWRWKKYGVFSLCTFSLFLFLLNLFSDVPLPISLTGLSSVLILLILLKTNWKYFS